MDPNFQPNPTPSKSTLKTSFDEWYFIRDDTPEQTWIEGIKNVGIAMEMSFGSIGEAIKKMLGVDPSGDDDEAEGSGPYTHTIFPDLPMFKPAAPVFTYEYGGWTSSRRTKPLYTVNVNGELRQYRSMSTKVKGNRTVYTFFDEVEPEPTNELDTNIDVSTEYVDDYDLDDEKIVRKLCPLHGCEVRSGLCMKCARKTGLTSTSSHGTSSTGSTKKTRRRKKQGKKK